MSSSNDPRETSLPIDSSQGLCACFDRSSHRCTRFHYDADLSKARVESDDDCDGVPDDCYEHTFDAQGRITREVRFVSCSDDTVQSCTESLYDEHGNYAGTEFDANCDGMPDNCRYSTWACMP